MMLLASLSALLQQQSVEVLTETLARLSAEQDAAARADAGLNDPEPLLSLPHPERAQQPPSPLPPPIQRPSRKEPTIDTGSGVRERGSVGLNVLCANEEVERVGVGLSVLIPAGSSGVGGARGAASSSGHRLPVVEAVLEGSPAFVDGRIRAGGHWMCFHVLGG